MTVAIGGGDKEADADVNAVGGVGDRGSHNE